MYFIFKNRITLTLTLFNFKTYMCMLLHPLNLFKILHWGVSSFIESNTYC